MKKSANYILGTHDFRNLCKMDVGNGVVNYIREVRSVDILEFNEIDNLCNSSMLLFISLWYMILYPLSKSVNYVKYVALYLPVW